jgi:hypothetical protein
LEMGTTHTSSENLFSASVDRTTAGRSLSKSKRHTSPRRGYHPEGFVPLFHAILVQSRVIDFMDADWNAIRDARPSAGLVEKKAAASVCKQCWRSISSPTFSNLFTRSLVETAPLVRSTSCSTSLSSERLLVILVAVAMAPPHTNSIIKPTRKSVNRSIGDNHKKDGIKHARRIIGETV